MKRTLGIIFTLMLVMIAFIGCEMETKADSLPSSEPQTGDLVLKEYDPTWTNIHYSNAPIERGDFTIGFYDMYPYPNTTTSLDTFGLKMEISRDDCKTWEAVTFSSTTYGSAPSGHVHIRVSQTNGNKSKTIRVDVITLAE